MQHHVVPTLDKSPGTVAVFPKGYAATMKRLISYCEDDLEEYRQFEETARGNLSASVSMYDLDLAVALVMTCVSRDRDAAQDRLIFLKGKLARFERIKHPEKFKGEMDVERAKAYPIKNFFKMNASRKVCCVYHQERTPSMHIYADNHFHCYSCDRTGDVIDLVMEMQGLDFKGAVEYLNKL